MQKGQVRGVLFDVDGTLYHQTPLRVLMIAFLLGSYCYSPRLLKKKINIIRSFRKGQEHLRIAETPMGNCKKRQLAYATGKTGESSQDVEETIEKWFFQKPKSVLPLCRRKGLHRFLNNLTGRNLRLAVFSDYPAIEKLKALGIDNYFSTFISSWDKDVKGFKPHTTGFAIAANKMKLSPDEILYVGDREEVDGIGANAAGMRAVIINKSSGSAKLPGITRCRSFPELLQIISLD